MATFLKLSLSIFKWDKMLYLSMEYSSMVSLAAFSPGDLGSNLGWLAVSDSNVKLIFMNNTRVWYSSKYCNPAMGDTLEGGDE